MPSNDGRFVASVCNNYLIIRNCFQDVVLHKFPFPQRQASQWQFLRWSQESSRILLADTDKVLIWAIDDPEWRAEINAASSNLGKLSNVQFGQTSNEILIFSAFGVKLTIWSLSTRRRVEIRDPKILASCHDYRSRTGHLATLIRSSAHDTLHLLAPKSYELVSNIELNTIDAQGIRWSPDGQWIAVWDAASHGFKVLILTADGHQFKAYSGGHDNDHPGLGIMTVAWSPSGKFLTIGDFNSRVMLLSGNTVSRVYNR